MVGYDECVLLVGIRKPQDGLGRSAEQAQRSSNSSLPQQADGCLGTERVREGVHEAEYGGHAAASDTEGFDHEIMVHPDMDPDSDTDPTFSSIAVFGKGYGKGGSMGSGTTLEGSFKGSYGKGCGEGANAGKGFHGKGLTVDDSQQIEGEGEHVDGIVDILQYEEPAPDLIDDEVKEYQQHLVIWSRFRALKSP